MFKHNLRRVVSRAVDDEDLRGHAGALDAFLAPFHEFPHGDFLVHRRDDDAQFHIVRRRVLRQNVLDSCSVVLGGSLQYVHHGRV